MIEGRFKRSAFHVLLGFFRAERLAGELEKLLQRRLQPAGDSVAEASQIIEDLRSQGHRLKLSEPDSEANLQVWLDGDFAVWFWADSPPKDVTRRVDRVEVLWQKV
jgi:hypothetical protein